MRSGRRVAALSVALLLGLVGCAARLQPMGPEQTAPRLTERAVVASDGYVLPLRVWAPPPGVPVRAVVLALHGFNDYANFFARPGERFAAAGILVYAYDQRGFGATENPGIWPGSDTLVSDLKTAADLVHARHPGLPFFLLGESMGGAVVLTALTGDRPPPADGAILVAPAVWGREVMDPLPRAALWLANAFVPGLVLEAPRELGIRPSDNEEMLRAMGRDPLVIKGSRVDTLAGLTDLMGRGLDAARRLRVPALVLYGAHEQVLPPLPVETAMEALAADPRHRVAVYPDGWHMLLRDRKGDIPTADILHWIADPAAPLPSGADRGPRDLLAGR